MRHGLRFAKTSSLPFPHFHEVSAKTGANVESAFLGLVYRMMMMAMDLPPTSSKYTLAQPAAAVSGGLDLDEVSEQEAVWREKQTRHVVPPPKQATPPSTPKPWPNGPVAAYARDVAQVRRGCQAKGGTALQSHVVGGVAVVVGGV